MKTRYSSKTISNAPGRAHNLMKNAVAMATSNRHNRKTACQCGIVSVVYIPLSRNFYE